MWGLYVFCRCFYSCKMFISTEVVKLQSRLRNMQLPQLTPEHDINSTSAQVTISSCSCLNMGLPLKQGFCE